MLKKGSSGRRKFSGPAGICPDACPDLCFRDRGGLDCTGCGCCVVRFQLLDESKMVSGRVSYDTAVKLKEKEASMLKRVLYLPEYAKDIRSSGMKQTVWNDIVKIQRKKLF